MTTEYGRRQRGDQSRRDVMERAVNLATIEGLEGLSIGGLAAETSKSKGGIVALFGSKEQLQLATVEAAREIFTHTVIRPALESPRGLARVRALVEAWLDYSEGRIFEGGCFFAAATNEVASRPGPVRDAVAAAITDWRGFLAEALRRAIALEELDPGTDPEQLAFEISAMLDAANATSLLGTSTAPYARARLAVTRLLDDARSRS